MGSKRGYGLGAIATGALALVTILFSNIQTTRDMLSSAEQAGGAPKMIADLILNPAFQVILVILAVSFGVSALRADSQLNREWKPASEGGTPHYKEIVNKRHFINETVELDGRLFTDCRFDNVTFVYNGQEATGFVGQKFSGTTKITTKNAAAAVYARFLLGFTQMDGFTMLQRLTQGPDGRWMSAGPLKGPEGLRQVMSELAVRYMKLESYRQAIMALSESEAKPSESAARIQAIHGELIEIAAEHLGQQEVSLLATASIATVDPGSVSRSGIVDAIADLISRLGRIWMRVSTAERRAQSELRP